MWADLMSRSKRVRQSQFPVIVAFLLASCSSFETQGLRTVDDSELEYVKVAADADFGRYKRLLVTDTGIFFPSDSSMTSEDVGRIRSIFRQAFIAELEGYEVTRQPGRGMLQVQASILDLRQANDRNMPNLHSEIRAIAKPGLVVFLMELRDSGTQRVLARAADTTENPRIASVGQGGTNWQSVEMAAARWAAHFRQFLDDNLGGSR